MTLSKQREKQKPATRPMQGAGHAPVSRFGVLPGRPRRMLVRLQLRLAAFTDWLAVCRDTERDGGGYFNLAPVVVGLGIAAYFASPAEPVNWLPAATALVFSAVAVRMQTHGPWYLAVTVLALFFLGMGAAQLRSTSNGVPVIGGQLRAEISGIVIDVDSNSRGKPRYTILPERIAGLDPDELPVRVRLSASSSHQTAVPGDRISGLAQLQGFSGPAIPGGYDFGFFNWFDGLGGTGFFLGAPQRVNAGTADLVLRDKLQVVLARVRGAIGNRIRAGIAGEPGDIAVALITGDRSGIDDETSENLRKSGLAHILAISGLHMALVTLTVIGALRFGLALVPDLALRYPVRKWAAAVGFVAATIYLLLSGAGIATQRAWIMIAVMLTATLLDRRALTMRNVAVAALIILLISPESLLRPGFQMSFAAVAALVAAYEGWNGWRRSRMTRYETPGLTAKLAMQLPAWIASIGFTSLVAGLATALFAAWHFHRVAPLGLLANLAAMPVVSIAVMPLALVSMLLMPYGFEHLTLGLLGHSIQWVIGISGTVAGFDAGGQTGILNPAMFAAGVAGLILLTALRSPLRFAGVLPIAAMALLWQPAKPPDLLISQDGRAIAIADGSGALQLLYPRRNRFIRDIWLRAWPEESPVPREQVVMDCNRDHCVARLATGHRVEIVHDPDLLDTACLTADILAAPRLRWVDCRKGRKAKLILKRDDFDRGGTHAVTIASQTGKEPQMQLFEMQTAYRQDNRPWTLTRLKAVEAGEKRWLERLSKQKNGKESRGGRAQ